MQDSCAKVSAQAQDIASLEGAQIEIDRKTKTLIAKDASGKVVLRSKVGIGSGGLAKKRNMEDLVTPSGDFKVELILSKNSEKNRVSSDVLNKYSRDEKALSYLKSDSGLKRLFENMSSLDFDADGKPDTAYGAGYLSLSSKNAVTGPKLSKFKGKDYWYSIAIHGTPFEKRNIGYAHSGGCVQLPHNELNKVIEMVQLGTVVKIK